MSTYLVNFETIDKIVSYLAFNQAGSYETIHPFPLLARNQERKLAHKLYAMNIKAVIARYGKKGLNQFGSLKYKYTFHTPQNKIRTYKALQCFHYQCLEGNISDSKLFQIIEKILITLAYQIVHELPEYVKAPWA